MVQLGVVVVLIPVVIYLFATAETVVAVGFLIWAILIAPLDNILKPLLLGRGVNVPTLVIFVGAIGGFLSSGIVGLFLGAVILAPRPPLSCLAAAEETKTRPREELRKGALERPRADPTRDAPEGIS